MRRLAMMLATMSLLMSAAPYGRTAPVSDAAQSGAAQKDKLEAAQLEEEKGDLARMHNDYASAVSHYLNALRTNRQSAELYNKLGIADLKLGDRRLARKDFSRAVKLDPQLFAPVNNLGVLELLDKKYRSAIGHFKLALALDESNAHTHLNLAEAWMGRGEMDHAMTEYARALELDADVLSTTPDGIQAQVVTEGQRARVSYMIAKMYMKRGNLDGALDYLSRAKQLHFPNLSNVYKDPDFTALWNDPRLAKIVRR
jgi:tetratricopeptide (TPR) repeat protein